MNYQAGKTVMLMTCDGVCNPGETTYAVLKSHFPDIEYFSKKFLRSDQMIRHTLKEFASMLAETIWENLRMNVSKTEEVIQSVFEWEYNHYINPLNDKNYKAFVLTIWSLAQQQEYLITKLNQDSLLFPKIYHSCGSLYLMEMAPPGKILDPSLSPLKRDDSTWEDRVKIALKLLQAISAMNSEFHQPLHMCDLKGENFGIGMDGLIKLIDTDNMYFEEKLKTELTIEDKCYKNSDCNFWDCHGVCDLKKGKCSEDRINNNLQSLCEDIFMPSLPIFNNGLLKNPPPSIHHLKSLLMECVYPLNSDQKATSVTYWKIYNLLKSTVTTNS